VYGFPKLDYAFEALHRAAGSPSVLLFDMRPVFWPILVIFSPTVAEQIVKPSKSFKYSVPKSPTMAALLPIIGPTSLISSQNEDWKQLRKRFNPGFAPTHLMTLIPAILTSTKRFLTRLDSFAKSGEVFSLDELCTSLTFDIIAAVVLDIDFKAQLPIEQQHTIVRQYRALVASFDDNSPFMFLNWARARRQRKAGEVVDSAIKEVISQKFRESKERRDEDGASRKKSVLDLSLQDEDVLTPKLLQETADQVKSFLFAGHDTTSITLQWTFYTLSRHPHALAALKEELDAVFGAGSSAEDVIEQLTSRGDEAVNKLVYTSAVIKEILRLFPPAGSARMAPKGSGFILHLDEGEDVCVDNFVLYNNHYNIQRNSSVYGDTANEFVPERWLGDTNTSQEEEFGNEEVRNDEKVTSTAEVENKQIPAPAWRPFERGPRNCIGQELANIEARVILACAVRRYDFEKVGLGEIVSGKDGKPVPDSNGTLKVKQELYNVSSSWPSFFFVLSH
jgi:cytochrome P450